MNQGTYGAFSTLVSTAGETTMDGSLVRLSV